MEIKDRISYLRKKYNLTYEEVAQKAGVGKSTVRKWENGTIKNIRRENLALLAVALNTTEEFLSDKNKEESPDNNCFDLGFVKVAACVPRVRVANPQYNAEQIELLIDKAVCEGAQIMVTPELSLSGATCGDLFGQKRLIRSCEEALCRLLKYSKESDIFIVIGMPVESGYRLYNCAVAIQKGRIIGVVPKESVGGAEEGRENRWFSDPDGDESEEICICGKTVPFGRIFFKFSSELTLGIEMAEELWSPIPKSSLMALAGANLILNLSSSSEAVSKANYRKELLKGQSARTVSAYVYASSGVYESTTDSVCSGSSFIVENGSILCEGKRFARDNEIICGCVDIERINNLRREDGAFTNNSYEIGGYTLVQADIKPFDSSKFDRFIEPHPFIPNDVKMVEETCEEIISIQTAALAKRLEHTRMQKTVIGISGGLDSTLALLICARTIKLLGLPSDNVIGITLPGFGTTDRTYNNALLLMKALGVTVREISIKDACIQHFKDIGHDADIHDITYENSQARERTQILMDIANKEGALLVGTGDLSESAMGWCTYNGDHMSMYGVNAGIPKTLMRFVVGYIADKSDRQTAEVLRDILDTPVSPELLPPDKEGKIAQKTEESIGPYELHDFFLYYFVRFGFDKKKIAFLAKQAFMGQYDDQTINKWLESFMRRFFISQFKRSCSPDAPKIGSVSLSPRTDWKMPSDADFAEWLK